MKNFFYTFVFVMMLLILTGCGEKYCKVNVIVNGNETINYVETGKIYEPNDDRIIGLFYDESYTKEYNKEPINENTTLYAKLKLIKVDIVIDGKLNTFEITSGDSFKINNFNEKIKLYYDKDYTKEYKNEPITESITLYGTDKTKSVNVVINGKVNTFAIEKGQILNVESINKDIKLYYDETYTKKYNNEPINDNITLYGREEKELVTVKVIRADGIQNVQIEKGGYLFIRDFDDERLLGLYYDEELTSEYEIDKINEDITLYAKEKYVTVKVYVNMISRREYEVLYNDVFDKNSTNLLYYSDENLYYDEDFKNEYKNKKLTEDLVLYKKEHILIIIFDGKTIDLETGTKLTEEDMAKLGITKPDNLYTDNLFIKKFVNENIIKSTYLYEKDDYTFYGRVKKSAINVYDLNILLPLGCKIHDDGYDLNEEVNIEVFYGNDTSMIFYNKRLDENNHDGFIYLRNDDFNIRSFAIKEIFYENYTIVKENFKTIDGIKYFAVKYKASTIINIPKQFLDSKYDSICIDLVSGNIEQDLCTRNFWDILYLKMTFKDGKVYFSGSYIDLMYD
ncbi:MAG: hypothetical protein MRZ09_05650 [Coprobacillus sp.]|nr:hypothetical protein [Coprobacillus sp.]MDY4145578.1 hypothetical protein [Bacilli bacterium]